MTSRESYRDALLPHLAATFRELREEQRFSLRQMAAALTESPGHERLARGSSIASLHSNLSRVERAEYWPRDPDAWVAAYATATGRRPADVWVMVIKRWEGR